VTHFGLRPCQLTGRAPGPATAVGAGVPGEHRTGLIVGVSLALATAALAAGSGCAGIPAVRSDRAFSEHGKLLMNRAAGRRLHVLEHVSRRDARGHLVASLAVDNLTGKDYEARVRVMFRDEQGTAEGGSGLAQRHLFPPGRSRTEWTSYGPGVTGYVVEVMGPSILP
jgi:hypothetical protein